MCVCGCKNECLRSCRRCSESRRGCSCAEVGAGTPAARMAARAAAVRRGGCRGEQRGVGEGSGEAGEGTWTCAKRRWDGGGAAHGRQSGGGVQAERTEEAGDPRKKTRTDWQNLKSAGTSL
jgi:hypothetical protein